MSIHNSPLTNKHVNFVSCQLVSPVASRAVDLARFEALGGILSDLRPAIKSLTLYENIFQPTLTGTVELQDNVGLSVLLPLLGIEQLAVVFSVYDSETNGHRQYGTVESPLILHIYAQTDRTLRTVGAEQYKLRMASPEFVASLEKRISYSYKDQRVESIIKDIMKNWLHSRRPFVDVETTKTPMNFVAPFVSPLDAIKLMTLCGQNAGDETNYMFYETLDGFHFKSIRKMIRDGEQRPIPVVTQTMAGTQTNRVTKGLIFADQIDVTSGYDFLYLLSNGYFASTTYMVDVLDGSYGIAETRSSDAPYVQRSKIGGPSATSVYDIMGDKRFGMNPTARVFVVPTTEFASRNSTITSEDSSVRDNFIARTIDGRNRELLSLQMRTVRVKAPGSPELHAGGLVTINLPSPLNNNRWVGGAVNGALGGRYLIVAAKHTLINNGVGEFHYETTFEAGTDA